MEPELISDIVTGIETRGAFANCRAVIGGYIGSAATGEVMVDAVRRVKRSNAESLFFCDPVMGDRDKGLYVSEDIVRFYREQGGPASDILKPNAFELEVLSGIPVDTMDRALEATSVLLERWNLKAVVVSSVPAGEPANGEEVKISCLAVTPERAWAVDTPLLPVEQKGAGDAFMALFVAHYIKSGGDLAVPLEQATSSIWSLMNRPSSGKGEELQLIEGQDNFSNPARYFRSREIEL